MLLYPVYVKIKILLYQLPILNINLCFNNFININLAMFNVFNINMLINIILIILYFLAITEFAVMTLHNMVCIPLRKHVHKPRRSQNKIINIIIIKPI